MPQMMKYMPEGQRRHYIDKIARARATGISPICILDNLSRLQREIRNDSTIDLRDVFEISNFIDGEIQHVKEEWGTYQKFHEDWTKIRNKRIAMVIACIVAFISICVVLV